MQSTIFVKLGVLALLATGLMAAQCEQSKDFRFVLEKMPKVYLECASKVVPGLKGSGRVSQADLLRYTATLKKYAHSQNRCLRGAVAWSQAQYNAYRDYK